jgi:hypothetical protein
MMEGQMKESIAQRVARGKGQNCIDNGAIVPFPDDVTFDDPMSMLKPYDRAWVTEHANKGGQLSSFIYRSGDGQPILGILRYDFLTDKKQIRAIRCERTIGMSCNAALRHVEGIKPLFNLDELASRCGDAVLVVEGEKTVAGAESRFPAFVSTTWPGGAMNVQNVELQALVGRDVIVWPDHDPDGLKAAKNFARNVLQIGASSCRIVQVPAEFPEKWDLADEPPAGWTEDQLADLLASAPAVSLTELERKGGEPLRADPPPNTQTLSDLTQDEEMLRYLVSKDLLNLGTRSEWISVGMALHSTHGDAGFILWDKLSSEADGYDTDTIQSDWDSFGRRREGARPLTVATFAKQAREAGWSTSLRAATKRSSENLENHSSDSFGAARFGKNVDPAAVAVQLAEEAGDEFWLDQHDKPYVSFVVKTPDGAEVKRHAPIASGAYKRELGHRYYIAMINKVLGKDHLSNATTLLEYLAREGGLRFTSSLRVGEFAGRIYVDLGRLDGAVVEVDEQGWRLTDNPPVRFIRGTRGELPEPLPGGTLSDFEQHFNLSKDDVLRAVAFMIGTFNLSGSYPILFIEGEQGTCKSTLADLLVALTDPPTGAKSARFSFAPDERDFHVSAAGARVLCFDNISNFSAAAADALCRMATGAASSSRKLYTDDEEVRLVVLRPLMATCIGLPSSRADLLSRSVRIKTLPVVRRRTEDSVMQSFNADRAKLFGFLLTCVSAALRDRTSVEEAVERGEIELPRMGDFGQFIEAAAEPLGLLPGEFSKLIEHEQTDMQIEAALSHPLGAALLKHFSHPDPEPILAPARDVLTLLQAQAQAQGWWPPANKLGNELRRIAVGLRHIGIEVETTEAKGHSNVMQYHIFTTEAFTASSEATSTRDHF